MPLWVALHGAFNVPESMVERFGEVARAHGALLLAPQASRPCGEGFCWSFARDAVDIGGLVAELRGRYPIDPAGIAGIGYSMGGTMGLWLLAQNPLMFEAFALLGMGSAFEPWEHDDGGIDEAGLKQGAATTRILLAGDRQDPAGTSPYFDDNLHRLQKAGFGVEVLRPDRKTHDLTDEMRDAAAGFLRSAA